MWWIVLGGFVLLIHSILFFLYRLWTPARGGPPNVTVLVLGDVGRSPRMQYHALSLAKHGCNVCLVGYRGKDPLEEVQSCAKIDIRYIDPWSPPEKLPFSIKAVLRVLSLCVQLFVILVWTVPSPRFILAQTPPAVPALLMALIAAGIRRSALLIDYHNFGYSLLAIKLGWKHPLTLIYAGYERILCRFAHGGFCVTEAMQEFLTAWQFPVEALHDRPASIFVPTPIEKQHTLFTKLWADGTLEVLQPWWPKDGCLFTQKNSALVTPRMRRPKIIMSATSWTADEDFGQLLNALPALNEVLAKSDQRVLVAVSGVGDLRADFERKAEVMMPSLSHIRIVTLWLSFADYAAFLGSADLGLSLHTSSSGLDLPMKVLDMFGAGLPVCARDFKALTELVRHGENGFVFKSDAELVECLAHGLGIASPSGKPAPELSKAVRDNRLDGWDKNWDTIAWPYLSNWLPGKHTSKSD